MGVVSPLAVGLAAVTLAALLGVAERRDSTPLRWLLKPAASGLFLVAAFGRGPHDPYDWLIVAALGLSAAGDVCLIPAGQRWFLGGLTAFLLAHLAYLAAFAQRARLVALDPILVLAVGAASGVFLLYFRPHLGRMLWPVVAYVVVITLMLIGAWATAAGDGNGVLGWRAAGGATLFYLSDVAVARDRFLSKAGYANRAVGLTLYYGAQFLLAFSIRG